MNIQDHYADLLNATYESILFADCSGIIQFWNPGCERMFGFSADEAIGQSLDIIIPERLRRAHWKAFFEAVERGDTLPGRRPARTKALSRDGDSIYIEMSFAMAHNANGSVIGSIAVARPDRRQSENGEPQTTTENKCPFAT